MLESLNWEYSSHYTVYVSSSIAPGPPVWWQRVLAGALPELHEVHLSAAFQQLCPLHLLTLHLVPAHPPHRRTTLPLPSGIHGWLLWDRDQPVLLQPLSERRGVCPQRGRVHLYLPRRLHRWVARECVRVLFESVLWKSLFLSDEQCDIFILMINSLFQETVE